MLSRGHADGLVVVAFTLVAVGLLTKAGAVPFHFWLSDAYAVAPAPVCILFAGVMSDLGLHAVGRTYWQGFSGVLGADAGSVRGVLVGLGVATALLGGAMAFVQAGLKRMLAFVVICHVGVFLAAIGLLTAGGLAGATVYIVADGLVKGALFCAVASLARRLGDTDELSLHGRGGSIPITGAVLGVGGVALAVVAPMAILSGHGWLRILLIVASALSGGAVLRAAGRIFLGLGSRRDELLAAAPAGAEAELRSAPRAGALLWLPGVALLAAGLTLAFTPGLPRRAVQHAERVVDRPALARETLHGVAAPLPKTSFEQSPATYVYAGASALLAVAFAALGLYRRRVPGVVEAPLDRLKLLHDGVVGEYVTWLTVGTAVIGVLFAVLISTGP